MATRAEPSAFRKAPVIATTWRRLLWTFVAILALAYGWQITRIDLYKLAVGLPNMQHIIRGLVTPDFFTRTKESTTLAVPVTIGPTAGLSGAAASPDGRLHVEPATIGPGDSFVVRGSGLDPGTEARFSFVDSTGLSRIGYGRNGELVVGPDGTFWVELQMPATIPADSYTVRAEVVRSTGQWLMSETLQLSLEKMVETIFLALMGTAFGVMLSVPLSFLAAKNLMAGSGLGLLIYSLTRTFFNLTRSIEVMIVAVIMAVVVGIGPFAGVMALVIHSIGALGKLYSESIESIDPGPIEAITATGANRLQVVLFAVVPQVVPQFISFTLYRWDINVRMSTIIGFVGGGGIGYLLIQYINLLQWNQAGTVIWLIAIVVGVMDYASAIIRERVV
jgi:phosphonate transport system permease protein